MRPPKLTQAARERLRKVASLQIQTESVKTLALEFRVTPNYIRQLLSKLRRELSNNHSVSRGAE